MTHHSRYYAQHSYPSRDEEENLNGNYETPQRFWVEQLQKTIHNLIRNVLPGGYDGELFLLIVRSANDVEVYRSTSLLVPFLCGNHFLRCEIPALAESFRDSEFIHNIVSV